MNNRAFYLKRKFNDFQHFPYGFSRAGDFTKKEAEILEGQGNLFLALLNNQVTDPTEADKHFVAVMRGEAEAESAEEKVWLKYMKCSHRSQIWLNSSRKAVDDNIEVDVADDDMVLADDEEYDMDAELSS